MDERDQVLTFLTDSGALRGIRWAHGSAYREVWQDYNPAGGHDQGWIGYTAHKYMINRQDRVFQCDQYAAPAGEEAVGRDVLADGIVDRDFQTMPQLKSQVVVRDDL